MDGKCRDLGPTPVGLLDPDTTAEEQEQWGLKLT